jgi:hypothetical protein
MINSTQFLAERKKLVLTPLQPLAEIMPDVFDLLMSPKVYKCIHYSIETCKGPTFED